MRHYHPDANPDPQAHKRAQAITAAYSVLRDRGKRAKYDEERLDADIWRWIGLPQGPIRPPAARTAGIAASVFAIVMVVAVLLFVPREQLVPQTAPAEVTLRSPAPGPRPVELQPESQRLADLAGPPLESDSAAATPPPKPVDEAPVEPLPAPAKGTPGPSAVTAPATAKLSKPQAVETRRASPPPVIPMKALPASGVLSAAPKVAETSKKPAPASPPVDDERVASLQRISSGFYDQSLQNADQTKKELLLSVRVRETYQRAACRSNSCVADSYLRQIRDVGAIMQNRIPPSK